LKGELIKGCPSLKPAAENYVKMSGCKVGSYT